MLDQQSFFHSGVSAVRLETVLLGLFAVCLTTFLWKLSRARGHVRRLKKMGLPMPHHNPLFGHLGLVASIKKSLPSDAHGHYLADQVRRRYPALGPAFYLDIWPFGDLILIVIDPVMIAQFCQPDHLLPKHPGVKNFLNPITGGYDLNCLEGDSWKLWRRLFNPGFNSGHLLKHVPSVVEEVLIFREDLRRLAKEGKMFSFEKHALNVTIDVIGKLVLDSRLNTQRGYNPMISALLAQRRWAFFGLEQSLLTVINHLRYFHIWNNRRVMDNYINKEMDERYLSTQGVPEHRTIIDLALSAYKSENAIGHREPLDPTFRKYAISQMKVFIFAGHDANSTTICYSWLLLSRNPKAMAKVRAEHDAVLGPDTSKAAATLTRDPSLLNQLPYTLAIIKETLRLFPAVSSARMGVSGFTLTDRQGRQFPTENCLVWANHHGVHNNPSWWKRVDEFLPERWLPESTGTDLHPIKNAWRPFEFGPRACIGVELALMEIKVVLALTLREFDLEEAYEEWDRVNKPSGIKSVNGERAYQIQLGSAHPADGLPVRMRTRDT